MAEPSRPAVRAALSDLVTPTEAQADVLGVSRRRTRPRQRFPERVPEPWLYSPASRGRTGRGAVRTPHKLSRSALHPLMPRRPSSESHHLGSGAPANQRRSTSSIQLHGRCYKHEPHRSTAQALWFPPSQWGPSLADYSWFIGVSASQKDSGLIFGGRQGIVCMLIRYL